jgi:hypothetical protein
MSTITNSVGKIYYGVNKIYQKSTYLERYGGSVIFSIFAILGVALYFTYLHLMNNSGLIKKDWNKNRCNPLYIPFAGLIMNPTNMSKFQYTADNFSNCFQVILQDIMEVILVPLEAASVLISASVSILSGVINSFMVAIANLRDFLLDSSGGTAQKQTAISTLLTEFTVKIKSALGKGQGIIMTILYIFFSVYEVISSSFYVLLVGSSIILGVMYAVLLIAWGLYIYFVLIPIVGLAISSIYIWLPVGLTVIYVAIMVVVLIVVVFTAGVISKTNTN